MWIKTRILSTFFEVQLFDMYTTSNTWLENKSVRLIVQYVYFFVFEQEKIMRKILRNLMQTRTHHDAYVVPAWDTHSLTHSLSHLII